MSLCFFVAMMPKGGRVFATPSFSLTKRSLASFNAVRQRSR